MTDNMQKVGTNEIEVRSARHEDYEAVVNIIPNLYNGKDYLPHYYHEFLEDERRFCAVALVNDDVASFAMLFVIDDETTVVGQAGRTKPKYQGMALSKLTMQYAVTKVLTKFPKVRNLASTSINEKVTIQMSQRSKSSKLSKFNFVSTELQKNSVSIDTSLPHIKEVMKKLCLEQTRLLTPSEAVDVLSALRNPQRFQYDHAFIINWEPFTALPSNYHIITSKNSMTQASVMITQNKYKELEALSFGSVTNVNLGCVYRVQFSCLKEYISKAYGKYLLLTHLVKHLFILNQYKLQGRALFDFLLQKEFDPHIVLEALEMIQVTVKEVRLICHGFALERDVGEILHPKL